MFQINAWFYFLVTFLSPLNINRGKISTGSLIRDGGRGPWGGWRGMQERLMEVSVSSGSVCPLANRIICVLFGRFKKLSC